MAFAAPCTANLAPSQRARLGCDVRGLAKPSVRAQRRAAAGRVQASAIAAEDVPDMNKRVVMNLLLAGAIGAPVALMAVPYIGFFVPPRPAGTGGGLTAKDALGNDVTQSAWVKSHQPGDHSLVQGLKSDATYLIVKADSTIEKYGLNAVCTHLGCVVPWVGTENKFKCPCHGSQYNNEGKVIRGPAPLSLALAHININDDLVVFSDWKETDFRTGKDPWWA